MTNLTTPDLSDLHPELKHLPLQFRQFGLRQCFAGPISTIACHADNSRVAEAVSEPGEGRVLLVDGASALHRSLLGDRLAQLAADNQWAGVVVLGAIRDVEVIDGYRYWCASLGRLSGQNREAVARASAILILTVCEMTICPGDWLYADRNGVLIGPQVAL